MLNLKRFFKLSNETTTARTLYGETLLAARQPALFADWGVPDTPEGRFEMLSLMAFLVLRRLKQANGAEQLAQAYFDVMFDDVDSNLREMGVGDLSVGKRVKKLAESFYGRIKAYEDGLANPDPEIFEATLERLLFRGAEGPVKSHEMAAYVRATDRLLAAQADESLKTGRITFTDAADADLPEVSQ